MTIATIGLDIAKHVFQAHGADAEGRPVLRRRLRRAQLLEFFAGLPRCLVALEACSGAHFWAREIGALGHEVRLLPPQYVRPYVKRGKNDAADAEAICEAAARPGMRFVPVKAPEQQALLVLHRTRELLVRQRTMSLSSLRSHMAEFGVIAAQGARNVDQLLAALADPDEQRLPEVARAALRVLAAQLAGLAERIAEVEGRILAWHKESEASRRLATIPGVGPITASAILATVADIGQFRSGRQFSAWLGLTPRQHSSGGKDRLGRISKQGDGYVRRLLVHGARAVAGWRRRTTANPSPWLSGLLARRPMNVATVALANKNARVAWALLARGGAYRRGETARAACA